MKYVIMACVAAVLFFGTRFAPDIVIPILMFLTGLSIGTTLLLISLAYMSLLFKDTLTHKPDNPSYLQWFLKVDRNRAVAIHRGDSEIEVIFGSKPPLPSTAFFGLWMWYKNLVMQKHGLHVFFPYFWEPKVIPLPRYKKDEVDGKVQYRTVKKGEDGFFTNHVRTAPEGTPWYYEASGAEVQTMPVLTKLVLTFRIKPNRDDVIASLYGAETWNVVMSNALGAMTRKVMRRDATIDMIIGSVTKEIWKNPRARTKAQQDADAVYSNISAKIEEELAGYKLVNGTTLDDMGIEILKVDIIDFEPEISDEEKLKLRAAVLAMQEARKITIIGEATATAQRALVDAHAAGGNSSSDIIMADALVRSSQGKGGVVELLLAAFAKNQMGGK